MNKLWSFFWFVVATIIAITVLIGIIQEHFAFILLVLGVVIVGFVVVRIIRRLLSRSTHL